MVKNNKKKVDNRISYNRNFFTVFITTILILYTLIMGIVMLWAFLTSFKDGFFEYESNKFLPPKKWVLENYQLAFTKLYVPVGARKVYMPEMFSNSFLIAFCGTIISVLSHMAVAYVCARFKFKILNVIYAIVIVVMFIPIVGSLPASLRVRKALGFYDNFLGHMVNHIGFTGTSFLIFYATFSSIDMGYTEAAKIDGANNFYIMARVIFPLSLPTALGMGLLSFIGSWNEYTTQMIYLPSMPTLSYGLYLFQTFRSGGEAILPTTKVAACFVVCIPIIILFCIFRNKIMGNITLGGIKG